MDRVAHLHERLRAIVKRLNQVEERIKQAELICGQVVFPAVNELRYMARNLASLIDLALADQEVVDGAERTVDSYFNDAEMCCVRADHDITDALFAFISLEVAAFRRQYGASMVAAHLDDYGKLVDSLQQIQQLVIESRGEKRISIRIRTYDKIRDFFLPIVVDIYQKLLRNEEILRAHYLKIVTAGRRGFWVGLGSSIIILITLISGFASIASWFGLDYPHINGFQLKPSSAVSDQPLTKILPTAND